MSASIAATSVAPAPAGTMSGFGASGRSKSWTYTMSGGVSRPFEKRSA